MRLVVTVLAMLVAIPCQAQAVDPLTVELELDDLARFEALWRASDGQPSAAQLQRDYLDHGGEALAIFTPGRIENAENLAARIAQDRAAYADALDRCLPWLRDTQDDLRATYLALRGLLPEKPLPRIAVVMGAGNSGGTAGPGYQVLGLEVLCAIAPDRAAFAALLRQFYAHETIHTLQSRTPEFWQGDPMLAAALQEGSADYLALLVTGRMPNPERDAWAREREDWVFEQFAADRAEVNDPDGDPDLGDAAYRRWFGNAGSPPAGWPYELGYWVGMRMSEGYVVGARDPNAAIRELLVSDDPLAILRASGLAQRMGVE